MAQTNFALLTSEQKTAWSLDFWKQARNLSFMMAAAARRVQMLKQSEQQETPDDEV